MSVYSLKRAVLYITISPFGQRGVTSHETHFYCMENKLSVATCVPIYIHCNNDDTILL
jgi:hypothetical protein